MKYQKSFEFKKEINILGKNMIKYFLHLLRAKFLCILKNSCLEIFHNVKMNTSGSTFGTGSSWTNTTLIALNKELHKSPSIHLFFKIKINIHTLGLVFFLSTALRPKMTLSDIPISNGQFHGPLISKNHVQQPLWES